MWLGYREKQCVTCGKMFTPNSGKQIRCSECAKMVKNERNNYRKKKTKQITCKMCGEVINVNRSNKRFCSDICMKKYNDYSENSFLEKNYISEYERKQPPTLKYMKEIYMLLNDFNINVFIPSFQTVGELDDWKRRVLLQNL